MILYFIIIAISLAIIIVTNIAFTSIGAGNIVLHAFLNLIIVVGIDAIIAWIVHSIPEKRIHPFKKFYIISKTEKKFYEKLGVRKWKTKIPESGKYLCNFAKDKVEDPNNNEYVLKFLRETCYAEIMHFISIFFGFLSLAFMPYKLSIVLPIVSVNAILQLLPVIVQRYNRVRLISLYNYNEKHKKEILKNEKG